MNKLIPNRDIDDLPFGQSVANWDDVDPELKAWIQSCPIHLMEKEKYRQEGLHLNCRFGMQYNGGATFNRVRVSFDISPEKPFNK